MHWWVWLAGSVWMDRLGRMDSTAKQDMQPTCLSLSIIKKIHSNHLRQKIVKLFGARMKICSFVLAIFFQLIPKIPHRAISKTSRDMPPVTPGLFARLAVTTIAPGTIDNIWDES